MQTISDETLLLRVAPLPQAKRAPRSLATAAVRPPIPGSSSWFTALLIALGLLVLWAGLRTI